METELFNCGAGYVGEIIAVGTELLLGRTTNTNAQDISRVLSEFGIDAFYQTVVGDNAERLRLAVETAAKRANIIITSGGLGPTHDDITKETLSAMFGKKLIFNEAVANKIRDFFEKRLYVIKITDNNFRQAEFPEESVIFDNEIGTAPGCAFETGGKHIIMLPGPPHECRAMLRSGVAPYLMKLSNSQLYSHNIHIFGLGESAVEEKLRDLMMNLHNPTLAPYAQDGEVMLRLTAKAESKTEADALMAPILTTVRNALGDIIYGIDTDSLENTVASLLVKHNMSLATAESCTGGLISKRLTDIPGVSSVFMGGIVAYGAHSKVGLLDVDYCTLLDKGAISREVALAMANGVRIRFNADIGVSVTGIAGPAGDGSGLEIGTVFAALTTKDQSFCRCLRLFHDRNRVRISASSHVLDMIRRFLTGLDVV